MMLLLLNLKVLSLFALELLILPSTTFNSRANDINNIVLAHKYVVDTGSTIVHILAL